MEGGREMERGRVGGREEEEVKPFARGNYVSLIQYRQLKS